MPLNLPSHLQMAMFDMAAISASALSARSRLDDIEARLAHDLPFVAINQSLMTETGALQIHRSCGYSDRVLQHLGSDDFRSALDIFEIVGDRRSLRMNDMPSDFLLSPTVQDFILPEGFRDGVTTPLIGINGWIIGFQHLSFQERGHLSDEMRDFLDGVGRIIAALIDPGARAERIEAQGWVLIDAGGNVQRKTGLPHASLLEASVILRALQMAGSEQALWLTDLGDHLRQVAIAVTPWGVRLADLGPVETDLTARELQVAALLPQGLSNAHIASLLKITPRTASAHVAAILEKLDVMTRAAAAARIVTTGCRLL